MSKKDPSQMMGVLGGTAFKPVERTAMEALRLFFYNPSEGSYFSRTPKSWALIIIFYLIFYSCLAAFWYGLFMAFFLTIPADRPKSTLDDSLIGSNPGVGVRPRQIDALIDSSMFHMSWKTTKEDRPTFNFESSSNSDWAKRYENFTNHYNVIEGTEVCQKGTDKTLPCRFDKSSLGPVCGVYPFGYISKNNTAVTPCILLKVNRIFSWKPEVYEDEAEVDADDSLPEKVKNLIKQDLSKIYLNCEGEMPYDREGVTNLDIAYFPKDQGIDGHYFPYEYVVDANYHSPVVAVQFSGMERKRVYHIECRLYAKGMVHNSKDRLGLVRFELFMK